MEAKLSLGFLRMTFLAIALSRIVHERRHEVVLTNLRPVPGSLAERAFHFDGRRIEIP